MSEHIIVSNDRYITVPESLQKIGVQFDHNAETVTFDCPRYWDEHDMSTMKVYINYMRPNDSFGAYLCDSVEVDSLDNTIMHFDWTISGHVTEFAGPLSFLVCICDVDQNGDATIHWNSELNTQMYISSGMKCRDAILGRYPDIITHLLNRMNVVEDAADGVAANAAKVEAAMAGVVEYVNAAAASASAAKISEDNAAASLLEIGDSVSMAAASATEAKTSETNASGYAANAAASATEAKTSETNAENSALLAQSWASGDTGLREDEATNNAKYWSSVAQSIAGGNFATKEEAQGYATTAETNAKSYADGLMASADFASTTEAQGYATTAETNAKVYADSLAAEDIDCGTW